jgi:hypothetical protein
MNPIDLEQLVDDELKRLPTPRAPRSLLPRVLAATSAQPQIHAAGWTAWSRIWQVAAGVAAVVCIAGIWKLAVWVQPFVGELLPAAGLGRAASVAHGADEAATVARVLWDVMLQPVATYLSILVVSFALACALLWSAVERLAPGGASQR